MHSLNRSESKIRELKGSQLSVSTTLTATKPSITGCSKQLLSLVQSFHCQSSQLLAG